MKPMTSLFAAVLLAASLVLLGGCGPKPVPPYSSQANTNMPEGKSLQTGGQGTITEEVEPSEESLDSSGPGQGEAMGSLNINNDRNSEEYKKIHGRSSPEMQPIYFDFDQATIRTDQVSRLEHNADYLNSNPSARVIIEGNCDDRGTNEYNLALGERRALNAKNYLVELGVSPDRIRTISYGEERPLFTGNDEFSWSQNRRDDFVLE